MTTYLVRVTIQGTIPVIVAATTLDVAKAAAVAAVLKQGLGPTNVYADSAETCVVPVAVAPTVAV